MGQKGEEGVKGGDARRGLPRRGCARRPVGTQPHLLVVGIGNFTSVQRLAQLGARRGEIRRV
jgi:hypothetical protein